MLRQRAWGEAILARLLETFVPPELAKHVREFKAVFLLDLAEDGSLLPDFSRNLIDEVDVCRGASREALYQSRN